MEDEFGTIDLILRPEVYDGFKEVFRSSRFLIVTGKIQRLDTSGAFQEENLLSDRVVK